MSKDLTEKGPAARNTGCDQFSRAGCKVAARFDRTPTLYYVAVEMLETTKRLDHHWMSRCLFISR